MNTHKIHNTSKLRLNTPELASYFARVFVAFLCVLVLGVIPALADHGSRFNRRGNILIADQFNNRVIETDTAGNILWSFGLGPNDFSPQSIIGCNDAQRVG